MPLLSENVRYLPKTTPKSVISMIEYLTKDRDDEREARYRIQRFLEQKHPDVWKDYNDSRLYALIMGKEELV